MQPFCGGGWLPGGPDRTFLAPLVPTTGPGMASTAPPPGLLNFIKQYDGDGGLQIHRDKGTSSAGERQSQFSILLDRFVIRLLRTQAESACRQYRAARWFLLPEGELCRRRVNLTERQQIANLLSPAIKLDCKSSATGHLIRRKGKTAGDIKRNELVPHGNNSH